MHKPPVSIHPCHHPVSQATGQTLGQSKALSTMRYTPLQVQISAAACPHRITYPSLDL